ncbi:hypothetical protein PUNSTDRAFT_43835 [Punctularia strigosozonata HHB-11173 SS5]|uniref:uncharacterized protein n=1 Tax=Punctularia strigosozonata (strain HHB-11173) TaxID=741275 RepID=UPI0004416549|nr:uncharacterized protein PUNSTDRAFT_43835 [Punctularia strigosozonata HHB-11173 SS5]EIN09444.1 hypothetical protein PUNSTDRAFT_43835 [Punctularia strigosozonata HHB-11173 SS5]
MSSREVHALDTIETADYIEGDLPDEEVDVPSHLIPPNPDDSDVLPAHVHPSYPYGDPKNIKHPASKPRIPHDRGSRALFEDMGYASSGVAGSLRWNDLALDTLLPVDREREEIEKATQARKMASGATSNNPHPDAVPSQQPRAQPAADTTRETIEEDDEDQEEEDDHDVEGNNEGDS